MKDKTSTIRLQGHLHNEDKDILFRYCFLFHKLNTKSISLADLGYVRGVLWFVGRPTSEDLREFLDAKKSKIDSLIFQDKCKKKLSLIRPPSSISWTTVFSPVSMKLRYWDDEYTECYAVLNLRDKEIKAQQIMTVKYAIYAVAKEKRALQLQHTGIFSQLIFDSFVAISLYFLANKRRSSALIWTAQISIIIHHRHFNIISSGIFRI